jgi:hypothetical protein
MEIRSSALFPFSGFVESADHTTCSWREEDRTLKQVRVSATFSAPFYQISLRLCLGVSSFVLSDILPILTLGRWVCLTDGDCAVRMVFVAVVEDSI